jgi:hypothetical protein
MKISVFRNGRLTGFGTLSCISLAIALIAYTLFISESRFLGVGSFVLAIVLLGFVSMSHSATSIGLDPPCTNDPLGWRKAKKSYQGDEASKESTIEKPLDKP